MRWSPRPVVAAAALLALYITVPFAFGENDKEKTKSPAAASTTRAIPEATILNKHEVEGVSAARSAARPTRIWAGSRMCLSDTAGKCAPPLSISADSSASAAARSRWIGTCCIFPIRARREDASHLS